MRGGDSLRGQRCLELGKGGEKRRGDKSAAATRGGGNTGGSVRSGKEWRDERYDIGERER